MWVYIQSEVGNSSQGTVDLFTVGFYAPDGKWQPDSDHDDREKAAERVRFLNGGPDLARFNVLLDTLNNLAKGVELYKTSPIPTPTTRH